MSMDKLMFLYKFLRSPQSVGSLTPSSRFLAEAMVNNIDWKEARTIVELGAGTGSFTYWINQLRHAESQVLIFEQDHGMRQRLQVEYPDFTYKENAACLESALAELQWPKADYIISGLPFTNFSDQIRHQIMAAIANSLKPGGYFIAFQYSLHMKKRLVHYFDVTSIRFVPVNFPPAFVYYCQKT